MAGIWSGFLTFGLVTLPIRLYSGARGERIGFHMLHETDHARLKQQMVCTQDGEVVARDQTVRGYEYAKGEYVILTDEQIKAAAPSTARQLEIVEFCHAEEIDPVWFESSYYLMPETAGKRPYALLVQAMRESGLVAVAQLSMHNREYLSLIRPSHLSGVPDAHASRRRQDTAGQANRKNGKASGKSKAAANGEGSDVPPNTGSDTRDGLLLHTLYYLDEIRVADGFGTATAEPATAELQLAEQLMHGLAKPFDPTRFHDRYRENLEAAIAAQLEGKPAPTIAAPHRLAPVTDLMQTLKASLGQLEPGAAPPKKAPGRAEAKRPAARAKRRHAA